jgi:hypothetical protein
MPATQVLIEKINSMSADRLAELEDFVDFIRQRDQDRSLGRAAAAMSAPSFDAIWTNFEDDAYDGL